MQIFLLCRQMFFYRPESLGTCLTKKKKARFPAWGNGPERPGKTGTPPIRRSPASTAHRQNFPFNIFDRQPLVRQLFGYAAMA
jgi:hypothetical protein